MSVGLGKVTTRDGSGNSIYNLIVFSAFRMEHLLDHDVHNGNIWTTYEKKSVAERSPREFSPIYQYGTFVSALQSAWPKADDKIAGISLQKTWKRMISIHQLGRNINANPIPGLGWFQYCFVSPAVVGSHQLLTVSNSFHDGTLVWNHYSKTLICLQECLTYYQTKSNLINLTNGGQWHQLEKVSTT